MAAPASPAVLGYWAIRGLAHPIRTLLAHTGTPFTEVLYGDGPEEEARWAVDKKAMSGSYAFPNLPFYDDGSVKLTQSVAIMRYIGRKHGLCGSSDLASEGGDSATACDLWVYQALDFRRAISATVYTGSPSVEALRDDILPGWLSGFEAALGDKQFAAGVLTIADFMLCESLAHVRALLAAKGGVLNALAPYPRLSGLLDRFEALPNVAAAAQGTKALAWNGEGAVFR